MAAKSKEIVYDASDVLKGFDSYMWICFVKIAYPNTVALAESGVSKAPSSIDEAKRVSLSFARTVATALDKMESEFWPKPTDAENALRWANDFHASTTDEADRRVAIAVRYCLSSKDQHRDPSAQDVTSEYKTLRFDSETKCAQWVKYHFLSTTFARIESSVMTVLESQGRQTITAISTPSDILKLQPLVLYNLRANVAWAIGDALAEAE